MNLRSILEDANYECQSYSGRYMYGKKCLGVRLDGNNGNDLGKMINHVMNSVLSIKDEFITEIEYGDSEYNDSLRKEIKDITGAFKSMRMDSLGMGTIVYFTEVPWE